MRYREEDRDTAHDYRNVDNEDSNYREENIRNYRDSQTSYRDNRNTLTSKRNNSNKHSMYNQYRGMSQSGTDLKVRGKTLLSPRPQGQVGTAFSSAPAMDVRHEERVSEQALYQLRERDILTSRSTESLLDDFHDELNMNQGDGRGGGGGTGGGLFDSGLVRSVESLLSCGGEMDSMDNFQPILHSTHTTDPDLDPPYDQLQKSFDLNLNVDENEDEEGDTFQQQPPHTARDYQDNILVRSIHDLDLDPHDQREYGEIDPDYHQGHETNRQDDDYDDNDEQEDEHAGEFNELQIDVDDLPADEPFYIPGIGLVQSTESLGFSPDQSYEKFVRDLEPETTPRYFSPRPPSRGMFSATRTGAHVFIGVRFDISPMSFFWC